MLGKFANRYNLAFVAALALLLVLYVQDRRTQHALRAANTAAMDTMALLSASQDMLTALQAIESGARGYLITGEPDFLGTFDDGVAGLAESRSTLVRLLPRDDWHRDWQARIAVPVQARVDVSTAIVAAVRAGHPQEGVRLVRSRTGKVAMDQVLAATEELHARVRQSLAERNARIVDQNSRAGHLRLVMLLAGGGLLLGALVAINFQLDRRRRALDQARAGEARERRQHAFLRTIIDADENPIFVRDGAGRFILSNGALGELVGCTPAEIEREEGPSADCMAMLQPLLVDDPAVDSDTPLRVDAVQMIDADWQPRWLQMVKRVLPGETDGSREVLTVAVDITERLRAQRIKDEFVANVSHELRTPLTAVRGALDVLAQPASALPADTLPMVGIAQKNTERLIRLINDILDMQKLEAGHLRLHATPQPLRPLLVQALEHNAGYALPHGVTLQLLPGIDAHVEVDADRLAQVMANLLSNAIKHSPRGAQVDVAMEAIGDQVEISVRDYGHGIPREFRPHVFERFTQAEGSATRRHGGTGLGLAIAHSLVERMGGQIGFESWEGLGSRFHVRLPQV